MASKPRIFLSSTSDLKPERTELVSVLGRLYEVYSYDQDRARRQSPESHCRKMIKESHVFLGVLGTRYGSRFPGSDRSIVEWEFDTARAEDGVELLNFVKTPEPNQAVDPEQQAFIDRISDFSGGLWCEWYETPAELVERARNALESWLVEFWAKAQRVEVELRDWLQPYLLLASVLAVLALVAIVFTPLRDSLTPKSILGVSISVAAVVLLCLVLLWTVIGGRK